MVLDAQGSQVVAIGKAKTISVKQPRMSIHYLLSEIPWVASVGVEPHQPFRPKDLS
jgi:hypothetical protein